MYASEGIRLELREREMSTTLSTLADRIPWWGRAVVSLAGMLLGAVIAVYLDHKFDSAVPAATYGYILGATSWWRYAWINAG